ncbi:hypothetical protein [Arcobacter sp.]|uniref:restriction endonuclease n=1 Tax=Arcobacter sp. TaxID=1872629 RepID=UPI0039BFBA14
MCVVVKFKNYESYFNLPRASYSFIKLLCFLSFLPLGTYNPDWVVLIEKDNSENLYFVVKIKGLI